MGFFNKETDGGNLYLSYVTDTDEAVDRVACGMLDNNQISGILPMNYSQFDGKKVFRFCITGLETLEEYVERAESGSQILLCLKDIAQAVAISKEFMLNENMFLFEPNCVYIDESGHANLLFIPVGTDDGESGFREFCSDVIHYPKVVRDTRYTEYVTLKEYFTKEYISAQELTSLLEKVELNSAIVTTSEQSNGDGPVLLREVNRVTNQSIKEKDNVQLGIVNKDGPVVLSRTNKHSLTKNSVPIVDGPIILSRGKGDEVAPFGHTISISRKKNMMEPKEEERTVAFDSEDGTMRLEVEEATVYLKLHQTKATLTRVQTGETITISQDLFRIGKSRFDNEYSIFDNAAVSRHHAVLLRKEDTFYLKDLGSKNATYINGKKIQPELEIQLNSQCKLTFANEEYQFQIQK